MGFNQSQPECIQPTVDCDRWCKVLYSMPRVVSAVHGDHGTLGNALLCRLNTEDIEFKASEHPNAASFLTGLYRMQMSDLKRTPGRCVSYLLAYGSLMVQYKTLSAPDFSEDVCVNAVSKLLAKDFQPETGEYLLTG